MQEQIISRVTYIYSGSILWRMDINEAKEQANLILEEERISPTCSYMSRVPFASAAAFASSPLNRNSHPRAISEHPDAYRFNSVNEQLLSLLFSKLGEKERRQFIDYLQARMCAPNAYRDPKDVRLAGSTKSTSELPLIAEFLVRHEEKDAFMVGLQNAPTGTGFLLILAQLEDMIVLDSRLFRDSEYDRLQKAVLSHTAAIERIQTTAPSGTVSEKNTMFHLRQDLPPLCNSVVEMCRKAKYLSLKAGLLENANTEVNKDRARVQSFLERLGFSEDLIGSLDAAEHSYISAASPFQFKECMGHLRSFLENLHLQAASVVHAYTGGTLPASWGKAIAYLVAAEILRKIDETFVTALYTWVSDTAVHPLSAEREYARVTRNITIEYGLLFLTRLDKWKVAQRSSGA